MISHRSQFLARLNERLHSDLASSEPDPDDPSAHPGPEHSRQPGDGDQPLPEAIAGDEISGSPAPDAVQVQTEQDPGFEAVAPSQRRPDNMARFDVFLSGEGGLSGEEERTQLSSRSKAGMPLRLREAIAPACRVSHEVYEPDGDDAIQESLPLADHSGDDENPTEDDATPQEPLPVHPAARLEHGAAPEHGQKVPGTEAANEQQLADELAVLEEDAGLQREQPRPDDDAAYQERAPGDQAGHERQWLNGGRGWGSATGLGEDSQDRQPLRRAGARQYGLHAAALPVAVTFVALAGYGLGILSQSGEIRAPLTRDTLRAWPTEPTAWSGQNSLRTEPDQPAEPSELVTVVVAPAPVAGVPEAAPAARVSTRALALPPPPKPMLRQSATANVASAERQLGGVVANATPALLEGGGGPFVAQAMRPPLGNEAGTSGLGDSPPVPSLKPTVIASNQRFRQPVEQAAEPSEVLVRVAPAPISLFAPRPPWLLRAGDRDNDRPGVRRAFANASVGGDGGDGSSSSGGPAGGAGSSTSGGGDSKSGSGGSTKGGASDGTSGGGDSNSGSGGSTSGGASDGTSGGGDSKSGSGGSTKGGASGSTSGGDSSGKGGDKGGGGGGKGGKGDGGGKGGKGDGGGKGGGGKGDGGGKGGGGKGDGGGKGGDD